MFGDLAKAGTFLLKADEAYAVSLINSNGQNWYIP